MQFLTAERCREMEIKSSLFMGNIVCLFPQWRCHVSGFVKVWVSLADDKQPGAPNCVNDGNLTKMNDMILIYLENLILHGRRFQSDNEV